jgi:hypothetical protein
MICKQRWVHIIKVISTPLLFSTCLLLAGCATQHYVAPDYFAAETFKAVCGARQALLEPLATAEGFVQEGTCQFLWARLSRKKDQQR